MTACSTHPDDQVSKLDVSGRYLLTRTESFWTGYNNHGQCYICQDPKHVRTLNEGSSTVDLALSLRFRAASRNAVKGAPPPVLRGRVEIIIPTARAKNTVGKTRGAGEELEEGPNIHEPFIPCSMMWPPFSTAARRAVMFLKGHIKEGIVTKRGTCIVRASKG